MEAFTLPPLTVQQQAIGAAMLRTRHNVLVDYRLGPTGGRRLTRGVDSLDELLEPFRSSPESCQAAVVRNLRAILSDVRQSPPARQERLGRYLDAYLDLLVRLDHALFPPTEGTLVGAVPAYIPDGFSDLGRDAETGESRPGREKIRLNKARVLSQSRDILLSAIDRHLSTEGTARLVAREVALRMNARSGPALPVDGRSVALDHLYEESLGLCRHHAIYVQVLLQALGLETRMIKGWLSGGRHAWNAVVLEGRWHILDPTNPWAPALLSPFDVYLVSLEEPEEDPSQPILRLLPGPNGEERLYRADARLTWRVVPPDRPLSPKTDAWIAPPPSSPDLSPLTRFDLAIPAHLAPN
jgi:transglutaminase-like putative cysteine protease